MTMLEAKIIYNLNPSQQYYWKSQIRLLIPLAGVTLAFLRFAFKRTFPYLNTKA